MTVLNYCNLLTRSKLVTSDVVKDSYRRWQDTRSDSEDETESFRKYLVQRKLLTEYQSHLLLRGHADGFFLGDYKIVDLIAKGTMAGVYKAVHASGQAVAIKVLPPSKVKDQVIFSRFQREGRMLTKLDHPNVVRALDIGESGNKHYIVMEYLEGEPLDETLDRRKRLPAPEAVRLIHQTLSGLQHVFEQGLVHRDLKPANLVLVPAPTGPNDSTLGSTVRILDIGLGRSTFNEGSDGPDTHLTADGTLIGSPTYMAPEQARSAHEVDIRSDIYSVGCIFYHMLTGRTPFPDSNILSQIVKHATEQPRPLAEFAPGLPDGLQPIINWMMAKDPNQRYPTPARAAQALQMFLPATPATPPRPPVAPPPPPEPVRAAPGFVPRVEPPAPPRPAPVPNAPFAYAPAPTPAGGIPVGRLEGDSRQRAPEIRKDGSGTAPKLAPVPAPVQTSAEYDVEIVTAPIPQPAAAPPKPKGDGDDRSLLDLDRRDYMMAGIGGGLVLSAILAGYGISRLFRKAPPTTTGEEKPVEQATPTPTPRLRPVEKKHEEPPEDSMTEPKEGSAKDDEKKDKK